MSQNIIYKTDSVYYIITNSMNIGVDYYIKVNTANSNKDWSFITTTTTTPVYNPEDCAPPCDELVFNGDFSTTSSQAFDANGNPIGCAFLHTNNNVDYYEYVCSWHKTLNAAPQWGTPQVKNNNGNYFVDMHADNSWRESVYTDIKINSGEEYIISFDYALKNEGNVLAGQQAAIVGFLNLSGPINQNDISNNLWIPQNNNGQSLSLSPSLTFTSFSFQFTANGDYNKLAFAPDGSVNQLPLVLQIDNVSITPLDDYSQVPIVTGPTKLCTPTIETYTIENYNDDYNYYYEVNGGATELVTSNPFVIDWSDYTPLQTVNTIKVKVGCEYFNEFKVYFPCNPFTSNYNYFCNQTITASDITQTDIIFNGDIYIDDNITLTNKNIKMGPMARIIVNEGYDFEIFGGSISDGCNYPWDGIYIENTDGLPNSKIVLNNVNPIEGAFNAFVSANNAEIEVTNCYFVNNDVGIKIRDYKPNLCNPLNPSTVPEYDALIHSNTFTTNNPVYSDFDKYCGIQIDTVYDITIGDDSYLSYRNEFSNLNNGIKINTSGVKIYNNKFENIFRTPFPELSTNGKPNKQTAILAHKPIVANNQTPLSFNLSTSRCIASKIIVGGTGNNQSNEFINCDFGIYSYKHFVEANNNIFSNQRYNAIWVWDAISNIQDNTINNNSNIIFDLNDNYNATILIEKTSFPSAAFAYQVTHIKDNTISNAKIGIYMVNCGAHPINPSLKSKVEFNDITFDNFTNSGSDYKYTGIWVANSDDALIERNVVKNNSGTTANNKKHLIGIRVDRTRDAWVSHNFDLNYLGTGIWVNGDCHNTQFSCNQFKACNKGIYTYTGGGYAAVISDQGNPNLGRPQDNFFINFGFNDRVDGAINLNTTFTNLQAKWFYRNGNSGFSPDISNNHLYHSQVLIQNPQTSCSNGILPPPNPDDDTYAVMREELYGEIVRGELDYINYEDEFEYYDDEYLYSILYNNPEIMYLGENDDTAYINFYNYLTNSNIREFEEVQELIDERDINQALMDNGAIVAENVIEANKKYLNDVYLNTFAEGKYYNESQYQTLLAIARLSPYIGGDAVYSARVLIGFNPNTENLPYIAQPTDSTDGDIAEADKNTFNIYPNPGKDYIYLESNNLLENNINFVLYDISGKIVMQKELIKGDYIYKINTTEIKAGVYFYKVDNNPEYSGKLIILKQ